jgi:hypothetical protein
MENSNANITKSMEYTKSASLPLQPYNVELHKNISQGLESMLVWPVEDAC